MKISAYDFIQLLKKHEPNMYADLADKVLDGFNETLIKNGKEPITGVSKPNNKTT